MTTADFVAALRQHRLLEPAQLDELRGLQARSIEPKVLAKELVQRGWLTVYQVNLIACGKASELRLGTYLVLERLGEGGMGAVLKARHEKMDRVDALKIIRKERLNNPDALKRFEREVRAAAQLDHPNIVRAYHADEVNGTHFLAMEYVEGKDLAQVVKEHGPLPANEACEYIRQAALGLQHAHEQGLVHRDIKPANLLRANKGGVVKILDMGIARLSRASADVLTQEGSIMGSLDYIAPEQAMDSSKVDIRADLYSLGCTFYHLLTGQVPFPGGEALAKLTKHQMDEPVPVEQLRPDVPARVAAIVRKLMAKKPEDRYQAPAEVVAALADMSGSSVSDQGVSPHGQPRRNAGLAQTVDYRPAEYRRWPLLAGVVVLGASLVGGVVLWWQISHGSKSDGDNSGFTNGLVLDRAPDPLPEKYKNSLGMEFVLVRKGRFLMGGGGGKPGTKEMTIPHDFYLGQYEVTQWEWMQVMKNNPSNFKNPPVPKPLSKEEQAKLTLDALRKLKEKAERDKEQYWKSHPVESVSWEDCQEFIKRLNQKEKPVGWVYSLPSEAEWEYACRGGGDRSVLEYGFDYYFDQPTNLLLPELANFKDSGKSRTCKVGNYKPNRLGLYDMHGNVWEWCRDEVPGDPKDPKAASQRVDRGGDWRNDSGACRAANRHVHAPSDRASYLGLRLARVPVTHSAPANAPFDAEQARAHQEAWAKHLDTTVEITNSIGMKLAVIPPGKFRMGSPPDEKGRFSTEEQHEVELTQPFYMGVHTVTVGQFRVFVRETGHQTEAEKDGEGGWGYNAAACTFEGRRPEYTWKNVGWEQSDEHPVVNVSWNDALAFCAWLTKNERRKFRLPTEAEWEYACRARTTTRYYSGDDEESLRGVANVADASLKQKYPAATWAMSWDDGYPFTAPVGRFKPNGFGLYDMHGNVWQWCSDWFAKDYYRSSPKQDPQGPAAGVYRVIRGGSFDDGVSGWRSAFRVGFAPSSRRYYCGFRVVCMR